MPVSQRLSFPIESECMTSLWAKIRVWCFACPYTHMPFSPPTHPLPSSRLGPPLHRPWNSYPVAGEQLRGSVRGRHFCCVLSSPSSLHSWQSALQNVSHIERPILSEAFGLQRNPSHFAKNYLVLLCQIFSSWEHTGCISATVGLLECVCVQFAFLRGQDKR